MSAATLEHGAPAQRCPRCGSALESDQDWCLECGAAVTTRVLAPPNWRIPIAIIASVVALTGLIVAIAVSSLSSDAERSVGSAPQATSTQPARTPAASKRKRATPKKRTSSAPKPGANGLVSWPAGKQAFTVILLTTNRDGAEGRARELVAKGIQAGVIETSKYVGLGNGFWIVFSGQFADQQAALAETKRLAARGAPGYVSLIKPR